MPAILKKTNNAMAYLALILAVLALLTVVAERTTPCALAASCSVGDDENFSGNPTWDSGTAFTQTLDHNLTADRTIILPDADVSKGSIFSGTATSSLGLLTVGTDGEFLVADSGETTGLNWAVGGQVATGTYTGDGATSYTPTDACGFQPKYVAVWVRQTATAQNPVTWWTTTEMVDNHANGLAIAESSNNVTVDDAIIAFTATSFTVDDNAADADPNATGQTYEYICHG